MRCAIRPVDGVKERRERIGRSGDGYEGGRGRKGGEEWRSGGEDAHRDGLVFLRGGIGGVVRARKTFNNFVEVLYMSFHYFVR